MLPQRLETPQGLILPSNAYELPKGVMEWSPSRPFSFAQQTRFKMTQPKIRIATHRGKQAFRWYVDGKPRHRTIKDPNNIEHERIALAAEIMTGQTVRKKKSLTQLLDLWEADLKTISAANADLTTKRARRTIKAAGVTSTDQFSVAKFRTAIHEMKVLVGKRDILLSESSRKYHARSIKQFAKWLTDEEYLDKNPLKGWQLKKVVEERIPRDRFQPDELVELIQSTKDSGVFCRYEGEDRAYLYAVAAMTGLRRKELARLTPQSFDWKNRTVHVDAAYTKDKKMAALPLNAKFARDLRRWMQGIEGELFPRLATQPTDKMVKRDLKVAGIPRKSAEGVRCFHSLRNTYISSLFDAGRSVAQVQRLARHSDVRLTMKYSKPRSDEWSLVDDLPNPLGKNARKGS